MKLFNNKELLLRVFAAVAEAVLFYGGFLFLNEVLGGYKLNIVFFVITALCGLFFNLLPYNNSDNRKRRLIFGSLGLALAAIGMVISVANIFNLLSFPVVFVFTALLYQRTFANYSSSLYYLYTAEGFFKRILFLFAVNGAVSIWYINIGMISGELMRYTVLYIIMGLYMLAEVKNFRYVSKNENSRKTVIDVVATGLMIAATIVISMPKVFAAIIHPFVVAFSFVFSWVSKLILLLIQPLMYLLGLLIGLIGERTLNRGSTAPEEDLMNITDKIKKIAPPNYHVVQTIGNILSYVIVGAICAFIIYLLFKAYNRYVKPDKDEDYSEEKEFVLGSSNRKVPKIISKLADGMKKLADGVSYLINADNRDKLRRDYKNFIIKLSSKKIVADYNNTAQDISRHILSIAPDCKAAIVEVTSMYEAVRYGTKYPEDAELKSFRKNIAAITRNIQQIQ